jgi:hypothetical protein
MTPYEQIEAQIEAAKRRIIAEYEAHHYTCDDPVGCEVRAWQALFREEEQRKKSMN